MAYRRSIPAPIANWNYVGVLFGLVETASEACFIEVHASRHGQQRVSHTLRIATVGSATKE